MARRGRRYTFFSTLPEEGWRNKVLVCDRRSEVSMIQGEVECGLLRQASRNQLHSQGDRANEFPLSLRVAADLHPLTRALHGGR